MDIQRIRSEVTQATAVFGWVETHPTSEGGVCVKAGLKTSADNLYAVTIHFANYPSQMPKVFVAPTLRAGCPHRYMDGNICYLHPSMWNPGQHNLTFVLARIAKWLNKYEVWCVKNSWPGAEVKH